ncbi:MAG: hypothetical protein V3V09_08675, partial [Arenicellales bacterium]
MLILSWQTNAFALSFAIDAFEVNGANPLSQRQTQGILSAYLGEHTDIERLREATQQLETVLHQ